MSASEARMLPGGRLHLHHGPIDLIIGAEGTGRSVAFDRARAFFATVLGDLVDDLPDLRRPVHARFRPAPGSVAARMVAAVHPHDGFVTPMAAVAGAVADGVLGAMTGPGLDRAWVNNGGDIAFHLKPGAQIVAAGGPALGSRITVHHGDPVRGMATSGWRGRSLSLGIADAVTVLARTAAAADVAATLIANAVDLPGHPAIVRRAASELDPDSDLGRRAATVDVGPLMPEETARALDRGLAAAHAMAARGLIHSAGLWLNGDIRLSAPEMLSERSLENA